MPQKKSCKKWVFITLIVTANLVGFNPALAFSDKDFARLEQRVRELEAKVFDAQQNAKIAICEKVYLHERLYQQAIQRKQDTASSWRYHTPINRCIEPGSWGYTPPNCVKEKEAQRDQEFSQRDQEVQTAQQELNSAQAEAKSAGAVCN
jgi:hypothetical protein